MPPPPPQMESTSITPLDSECKGEAGHAWRMEGVQRTHGGCIEGLGWELELRALWEGHPGVTGHAANEARDSDM